MRALGSEHDAACRRGGDSPDDGVERRGCWRILGEGGAVVVWWRRGGGIWGVGVLLRRRRCAGARGLLALRWDEDRAEARTAAGTSHTTPLVVAPHQRPLNCAQEFRRVEMTP